MIRFLWNNLLTLNSLFIKFLNLNIPDDFHRNLLYHLNLSDHLNLNSNLLNDLYLNRYFLNYLDLFDYLDRNLFDDFFNKGYFLGNLDRNLD